MDAFSLKYAQENLERIALKTVAEADETIITLDSGDAVVLMSMAEYRSWKETDYLLSNPVNRKYLLESIAELRLGKVQLKELAELVQDEV